MATSTTMSQSQKSSNEVTLRELRRREAMDPIVTKDNERYCGVCNRRVTQTKNNGEVGHSKTCDGDGDLPGEQSRLGA